MFDNVVDRVGREGGGLGEWLCMIGLTHSARKEAIMLKRIASKKGYSARDYAAKVLICSNYASVKIDIPGFKILKHDK